MASVPIEPSALVILRRTPFLLRALLADLDPEVLHRSNPEGWSIKDIVAHMHDAEDIAFVARVRRMLEEETPFIASIDPPARLREGGYANRTFDELLDDLASRRAAHAAWVAALTSEDLARPGCHDTAGTVTPAAIIHQWAFHDLAHTRQIMEMLQAGFTPGMANTRTFYPEAEALHRQLTG
jgi:hypothetical protein